jgi:hypothetical protein
MLVSGFVKFLETLPNPRLEVYTISALCDPLFVILASTFSIYAGYLLHPKIEDVPNCGRHC